MNYKFFNKDTVINFHFIVRFKNAVMCLLRSSVLKRDFIVQKTNLVRLNVGIKQMFNLLFKITNKIY